MVGPETVQTDCLGRSHLQIVENHRHSLIGAAQHFQDSRRVAVTDRAVDQRAIYVFAGKNGPRSGELRN
jgi:hypothetical protein